MVSREFRADREQSSTDSVLPDSPSPMPVSVAASRTSTSRTSSTSNPTRTIDDLRVLYDVHGSEIFRFCSRLVGDRGLAEEAVQETFLRAWRAAERWDPASGSVRTWMFAIARNVCIDLLRSRSRRFPVERTGNVDQIHRHGNETHEAYEESGFDGVMSSWMLEEALRRITPEQRDALVLTYVRDRPYSEIAAVLGIPEATLRTRVFYGLKSLRKVLEEMGWHE
jgi:RNA polymerase sigma-70 factor, ECF subfamily